MLKQAIDELSDIECRKVLNKMLKDNESDIRSILSDALSYVDNNRIGVLECYMGSTADWDISEATEFFLYQTK